jgi:hypothetical protein
MSRYNSYLGNGDNVSYGFDAPTGGFFYQHFSKEYGEDAILDEDDGLTMTSLCKVLGLRYKILYNSSDLVKDFYVSAKPSALQYNVGKMFGRDTYSMLIEVERDIIENFSEYIPK